MPKFNLHLETSQDINLDEITENHEEVGTYQGEVFVDVSLFVEGELELLGLV